MAQPALQRTYEQLRIAAIDAQRPKEILRFARRRFAGGLRKEWLLAVGEATLPHREVTAIKHAIRAWYELQPRHEPLPNKADRPPAPRVEIHYCECEANRPIVDVFGTEEPEHFEPFFGLKRCTLPDCGGILEPPTDYGWQLYAQTLLEQCGQRWCSCDFTANERNVRGVRWCDDCGGHPIAPHPLLDSPEECTKRYRLVVEAFYSGAVMRLTRAAEKQHAADLKHWRETGYGPGQSREREILRFEELATAMGMDAPVELLKDPPKPGDPTAPNGSRSGYQWHHDRELGQREKIDRVMQCGSEQIAHVCTACGKLGPKVSRSCSNHRLCHACRERRKGRFQRGFRDAQQAVLRDLWADPLRLMKPQYAPTADGGRRLKYGGPWGEKFLTLTLPHSGNVTSDVKELQRAWRKFWKLMKTHVVKDLLRDEPAAIRNHLLARYFRYCRVIEVTPGEDWMGHAHCHLWFVAPFIHHEVIRHLWGQALSHVYQQHLVRVGATATVQELVDAMPAARKPFAEQLRSFLRTCRGKNGRELALVWQPVIDIRKVKSGEIAAELCKYLVKDGERNKHGELELMDPDVFARIYAALEGRRTICASRGLLHMPRKGCYCPDCGGVYKRWIEPADLSPDPARGPPKPTGQLELELASQASAP